MTIKLATIVPLVGLLALSTACRQEPLCPELGSCGGNDPLGAWVLAPGYGSCTEDLYIPLTDLRLAQGNKVPGGVAPPEPTVYDWCDQAVAGADKINISDPIPFTESIQIGQASIKFNQDGTYTAGMTRTGVFYLDLPAACVRQYAARDGKVLDPNDPAMTTGTVCQQLGHDVNVNYTNSGAIFNTVCDKNPQDPDGCLCKFDASSTGGPVGFWKRSGKNTISITNQSNFPSKITFCNKGGELELTGANGDYLLGVRGLRTLKLKAGMP